MTVFATTKMKAVWYISTYKPDTCCKSSRTSCQKRQSTSLCWSYIKANGSYLEQQKL